MTDPAKFNNVVSFLWAIADLLNGAFQKSEVQEKLNPQTWAIARHDRVIPEPEGKDAVSIAAGFVFSTSSKNQSCNLALAA